MIFQEAFSETNQHLFDKIQGLDASDERSQKKILHSLFLENLKTSPLKSFLLSLLTVGFYPLQVRRECERSLSTALAARKFYYLNSLRDSIELIRCSIDFQDPKSDIDRIYKKLSLLEEPFSFNNIYTKQDIYFIIAIPPDDEKISRFFSKKTRKKQKIDFSHAWNVLKKYLKTEETKRIQAMNADYLLLKDRYLLSKKEIHARLLRTSVYKTAPYSLTLLPSLCSAFQEIIRSYDAFKLLRLSKSKEYKLLSMLLNLSTPFCEKIIHCLEVESIENFDEETQSFIKEIELKKASLGQLFKNEELLSLLLVMNESQAKLAEVLFIKFYPRDQEASSNEEKDFLIEGSLEE